MSLTVFYVHGISLLKNFFQTWPGLPVYLTPPKMFLVNLHLQCPPPIYSLLSAPLCLLLAGSCDKEGYSARGERRLNMVWWGMWRTAVFICTFTNRLASLPVDHPDLSEPGQGVPLSPVCWLHPALLLPPILPFSPSCCTSSASLFLLVGPHPRIAQQVPSENRAGDVGRVTLFPPLLSTLYLSLSLSVSLTEPVFCCRGLFRE